MLLSTGIATNLTASGNVGGANRDCAVVGFYVNSTSSGTIVFNVAGAAVTGTITPAIGWHFLPIACPGGCTVTIGGTLNVTIVYVPGQS